MTITSIKNHPKITKTPSNFHLHQKKPDANDTNESDSQQEEDTEPQTYGRGRRARLAPGTYKAMNEGLIAAVVHELDQEDEMLPPDLALVGTLNSEPKSIDEALRGPDAEEWRKALEYEINQLEKLGT